MDRRDQRFSQLICQPSNGEGMRHPQSMDMANVGGGYGVPQNLRKLKIGPASYRGIGKLFHARVDAIGASHFELIANRDLMRPDSATKSDGAGESRRGRSNSPEAGFNVTPDVEYDHVRFTFNQRDKPANSARELNPGI
jgi:hypothetical protein